MSEERPPERELPRVKGRLPFEAPRAPGASFRQSSLIVYGALTLGLLGVALYMVVAGGHALTSGYVAGPVIGALWFGLRLFMIWGSRR